jgi:hypothetical protein
MCMVTRCIHIARSQGGIGVHDAVIITDHCHTGHTDWLVPYGAVSLSKIMLGIVS